MQVCAANLWNDAMLTVSKGQTLRFAASGVWSDWGRICGSAGYESTPLLRPFEGLRRMPSAQWFELVGCVDRRLDQCFAIGDAAQAIAPAAGRLFLFANDVAFMYWNNTGSLDVTIEA